MLGKWEQTRLSLISLSFVMLNYTRQQVADQKCHKLLTLINHHYLVLDEDLYQCSFSKLNTDSDQVSLFKMKVEILLNLLSNFKYRQCSFFLRFIFLALKYSNTASDQYYCYHWQYTDKGLFSWKYIDSDKSFLHLKLQTLISLFFHFKTQTLIGGHFVRQISF